MKKKLWDFDTKTTALQEVLKSSSRRRKMIDVKNLDLQNENEKSI